MNREEHINWTKNRAVALAQKGDFNQAFNSIVSDLDKNAETRNHPLILQGRMLKQLGELNNLSSILDFINSIN